MPSKLVIYAVGAFLLISTITGAALTIRAHYISLGHEKALREVEQQNVEAKTAADKVRRTVRECYATGGMWSQATGDCEGGV